MFLDLCIHFFFYVWPFIGKLQPYINILSWAFFSKKEKMSPCISFADHVDVSKKNDY